MFGRRPAGWFGGVSCIADPVSCLIPAIARSTLLITMGRYRRNGVRYGTARHSSRYSHVLVNSTVLLRSLLCLRHMILQLVIHLFLPINVAALAHPPPRRAPTANTYVYAAARSLRLNQGHDAAVPSYQQLLCDNPGDCTAASRIAASHSSPMRHDLACPVVGTDDDIANLKQLLDCSGYNRMNVAKLFGVVQGESDNSSGDELRNFYPWGPSYITPVEAGSTKRQPPLPSTPTK